MQLRVMTEADISAGMRLKEIAGWNQTEHDWKRFLRASPTGCFVAECDGTVCGTSTTIIYENRFAWIGMVLVDPEYRSHGVGTQLLQRAIQHLDERRVSTLKLDATPLGRPIYEKLGFVSEYEVERWILKRHAPAKITEAARFESVPANVLQTVLTKDIGVFGANRGLLLKDLHIRAQQFTILVVEGGELKGYGFGRQGSFADHLGPWYALHAGAAQHILETFLARSHRDTVIVDCLKASPFASRLLRSAGFTYSRPLTRMFRGRNDQPGQFQNLCAILGPEFG